MAMEFGEKSYNPGVFRMDYWGGGGSGNKCYWDLFKRKLSGNIVLAAYDSPVTLKQLCTELGVAAVYLEEEIALLEEHEIVIRSGDKIQTNIIIFTDEYDKKVAAKIKPYCEKVGELLGAGLKALLPEFKKLDFNGRGYSDNRLLWTFANQTVLDAMGRADNKLLERIGNYPPLSNGGHGFVYGYDNDYANHHFNGIYGRCENEERTAYFSSENYRIIERCQKWRTGNWKLSIRAINDAVLEKPADENNEMTAPLIAEGFITVSDGVTHAAFPVFTAECLEKIESLLDPLVGQTYECIDEVCKTAVAIFKDHAPRHLHEKAETLASIHWQMDAMAFIIEAMVEKGLLLIPDSNEKLCMFGVIL